MSDLKSSKTLLSIVGPTAVGKTDFALWLASRLDQKKKWTGFDIISADSRQVYQGLEILSGADIPAGFQLVSTHDKKSAIPVYFQKDHVRLYGVSMILPNQEWSVSHFQKMAQEVIQHAQQHQRLVMIVGGTGLYHRHLLNSDPILRIPPNKKLRNKWQKATVDELQQALRKQDSAKFESMNHSDQHNPRRLLRALEVSKYQRKKPQPKAGPPWAEKAKSPACAGRQNPKSTLPHRFFGLTDDLVNIEQRIQQRVQKRFKAGAVQEVATLLQLSDLSALLQTATGFSEIQEYLEGKIDQDTCLATWSRKEFQYAKRQLTWWEKDSSLNWQKISHPKWRELAFRQVLAILGI